MKTTYIILLAITLAILVAMFLYCLNLLIPEIKARIEYKNKKVIKVLESRDLEKFKEFLTKKIKGHKLETFINMDEDMQLYNMCYYALYLYDTNVETKKWASEEIKRITEKIRNGGNN